MTARSMPDALKRITAFCAGRYNALRTTPGRNLANAYAEILVKARYATLDSAGPKARYAGLAEQVTQ
jgi:hypothetical protein